MKIIFKRIEIYHFMAFDNEIFDFDQQIGMNLICGKNFDVPSSKNGCAKSQLFLALLYGLYGQLPNKIKSENIANRNIQDKDVRIVVFLNINNIEYKVITTLNKRAQSNFSLFKIENEIEQDLTKSSILETRDFFENEILHCDISLFLRTILLTSEQNYNFFNLKKQDKKEFIEKIFDIGIFGEMYNAIHKDLLSYNKKILLSQNQLVILNNNDLEYKSRSIKFKKDNDESISLVKEKIKSLELKLNKLLSNKVQKNTELIEKCEKAIDKLNNSNLKLEEIKNVSKNKILEIKQDIQYNQKIILDREKIINKHSQILNKLCKDCKSIFSKFYNLDTYSLEINNSKKYITECTQKYNSNKDIFDSYSLSVDISTKKIDQLKSKIQQLSYDFNIAKSEQDNIQKQIEVQNFNLSQLQNKKDPYNELLINNSKQIITESENLKKFEMNYKYLKKSEDIISHESLKKFIIKDLIGLINNRIHFYLSKMGSKYTCIFDENLDYQFQTDSGPCELYNFSCGEKKRIEIATCLSFRDFIKQRSNITSNILILDEYIDSGIDSLAVDSILNILKSFSINDNQNIFVISHRAEVNETLFDRTIELQKKNGISTIHYL